MAQKILDLPIKKRRFSIANCECSPEPGSCCGTARRCAEPPEATSGMKKIMGISWGSSYGICMLYVCVYIYVQYVVMVMYIYLCD